MSTGYVYDERMCLHKDETIDHPECPERIIKIMNELQKNSLDKKMIHVASREVSDEEILKVHGVQYLNELKKLMNLDKNSLTDLGEIYNSVYLNTNTMLAARLSAGSVVELVNKVVKDELSNGAAIVRPPGHHAEADYAMGFCIFNNVAIVAQNILDKNTDIKRIAIIDWDVHHGNATQNMFYDDDRVLYISLHRYDNGNFYPGKSGSPSKMGNGKGIGKNINIAWSTHYPNEIGDKEYIYAFNKIIVPVLKQYQPQLILVSAGFDCALGDPLGKLSVTEIGFENMTFLLKNIQSKIVLVLEGGYNIPMISKSMVACIKILLGKRPDPLDLENVQNDAINAIDTTLGMINKYWNFNKSKRNGGCNPL